MGHGSRTQEHFWYGDAVLLSTHMKKNPHDKLATSMCGWPHKARANKRAFQRPYMPLRRTFCSAVNSGERTNRLHTNTFHKILIVLTGRPAATVFFFFFFSTKAKKKLTKEKKQPRWHESAAVFKKSQDECKPVACGQEMAINKWKKSGHGEELAVGSGALHLTFKQKPHRFVYWSDWSRRQGWDEKQVWHVRAEQR